MKDFSRKILAGKLTRCSAIQVTKAASYLAMQGLVHTGLTPKKVTSQWNLSKVTGDDVQVLISSTGELNAKLCGLGRIMKIGSNFKQENRARYHVSFSVFFHFDGGCIKTRFLCSCIKLDLYQYASFFYFHSSVHFFVTAVPLCRIENISLRL